MGSAVAYDPWAADVVADPYLVYERLREDAPAYHETAHDFWVFSRYDDVLAADRAHHVLSSAEGVMYPRASLPMMLTMDPPDHTRLRRLVARDFTPRAIAAWQPLVEGLVRDLVSAMVDQRAVDFMETLAFPLPVVVIAEVLGIPAEDHPRFKQWSDQIVAGFGMTQGADTAVAETVVEGIMGLRSYLTALIAERRARPGPDLLSRLADPSQSERVSDEELFWFALLLLVAGNETTTNLLGNMALAFVQHPDQWRLVQSHPEAVPAAVEEVLRYDSPIQGFFRTALAPYVVAGQEVPAGSRVLLLFGAANRDPRHYDRPDDFLVERNPTDHLAFGNGVHLCLGAQLARMEGAAVLRALLDRTDGLELTGIPVRGTNPTLRGVTSLPVAVLGGR